MCVHAFSCGGCIRSWKHGQQSWFRCMQEFCGRCSFNIFIPLPTPLPRRWWRRAAGIKTTDLSPTFGRLRWNSGSCIRVSIFVPSFIREARRLPGFVELIFFFDERGRDSWFIEWDDFRWLVEEEFVLRVGLKWTRVDWKINNLVDRLWMIASTYRVTDKTSFSFVMLFVQYIRHTYIYIL